MHKYVVVINVARALELELRTTTYVRYWKLFRNFDSKILTELRVRSNCDIWNKVEQRKLILALVETFVTNTAKPRGFLILFRLLPIVELSSLTEYWKPSINISKRLQSPSFSFESFLHYILLQIYSSFLDEEMVALKRATRVYSSIRSTRPTDTEREIGPEATEMVQVGLYVGGGVFHFFPLQTASYRSPGLLQNVLFEPPPSHCGPDRIKSWTGEAFCRDF